MDKKDYNNQQIHQVYDVVKEYPDMIQIYIYHHPYTISNQPKPYKKNRKITQDISEFSAERSLRRSKVTVKDIIICNDFDYWCTFTFNKVYHDRYNLAHCRSTMSLWLNRQRKHSPDLRYLIVPELHKDGALHFHALFSNFNGSLRDSGKKTANGSIIFNATGYRAGFTQFVKLDSNSLALARYITKQYLTKNMPIFGNKKRYWVSRGLNRPTKTVNGVSKFNLQDLIKNKTSLFTPNFEFQEHSKAHNIKLTSSNIESLI